MIGCVSIDFVVFVLQLLEYFDHDHIILLFKNKYPKLYPNISKMDLLSKNILPDISNVNREI